MIDESKIVRGWKVISKYRTSAVMDGQGVMRKYDVGIWTHRCTRLGPLMAFDNFEAAMNFLCGDRIAVKAEIIEAKTQIPVVLDLWDCCSMTCSRLSMRMKNLYSWHTRKIPEGTFQCQAIRCLE